MIAGHLTSHKPASRDREWGAEWLCKAASLDFCSLEGMCNYPDSCPAANISGQLGSKKKPGGCMDFFKDWRVCALTPPWTLWQRMEAP